MRNLLLLAVCLLGFCTNQVVATNALSADTLRVRAFAASLPIGAGLYGAFPADQSDNDSSWRNGLDVLTFSPIDTNLVVEAKKWYTLKLVLHSELDTDLDLGLVVSEADRQIFYLPQSGKLLYTGSHFGPRLNGELFRFSHVVPIQLQAGVTTVVYTRFCSSKPLRISPSLHQLTQIHTLKKSAEIDELSFRFFFFGGFVLVLLVSLLVLAFSRKWFHLYYSLYVLFVGFINGSFDSFFTPTSLSGSAVFAIGELSGGLAWLFYFRFLQTFLHTKQFTPRWHRFIHATMGAVVLYIVFTVVSLGILQDSVLYHTYRNVYALLVFVLTILVFVGLMRTRKRLALLIVSGGLVTTLSWVIYLSLQFGGYKNINIVRAGQLIETIVFGLAIALQVAEVYRENQRVQQALIRQLEEAKEAQEQRNIELEQKVQERTVELMQRNAELLMQSEENKVQNEQLHEANEEILRQKDQAEWINKQMTSSIQYAKRIQRAVLARNYPDFRDRHDMFLYIVPRDIVSGDFFYIRESPRRICLAVADCTGHGVPGAFMSILGVTLLDEVIRAKTSPDPASIFDELRIQLKAALKQQEHTRQQKDGMDLALCEIDLETKVLSFAGAFRPCWIVRFDQTEPTALPQLFVLDPDPMPIGIHHKEVPFTTKTFQLQPNDILYLFSDGFYSQFAGNTDNQLRIRGFRNLILSIASKPLAEQKTLLHQSVSDWKGEATQTDDILVLGFRVEA